MTLAVATGDRLVQLVSDSIHGALNVERTPHGCRIFRLPDTTRESYALEPFVDIVSGQASGSRLELTTAAARISIRARVTFLQFGRAVGPPRPAAITLTEAGRPDTVAMSHRGDTLVLEADKTTSTITGPDVTFDFLRSPDDPADITLWLPHNCHIEILEISSDTPLHPRTDTRPRWVHYGSSISHCGEATAPTGTWPARASRSLEMNLLNLGMSGCAMLDQFAADTIAAAAADLITLKIGINIVNGATMRERVFIPAVHAFLNTVRRRHPDTPLLVISPIYCPAHETQPGPTVIDASGKARSAAGAVQPHDGQLTLQGIRTLLAEIAHARSGRDPHLHYLDGQALLGPHDRHLLTDDLHPGEEGYALMADRFVADVRHRLPALTSAHL